MHVFNTLKAVSFRFQFNKTRCLFPIWLAMGIYCFNTFLWQLTKAPTILLLSDIPCARLDFSNIEGSANLGSLLVSLSQLSNVE